jgi:hypothetical protein
VRTLPVVVAEYTRNTRSRMRTRCPQHHNLEIIPRTGPTRRADKAEDLAQAGVDEGGT